MSTVAARSAADIDAAVTALDGLGEGKVVGVTTDVADPESCTAMATAVADAFGGIDVLCANAGIFPEAPLATMTPQELAEVRLDVNVKGTVFAVQACLPSLIASGRGRVILTSSITGPITGFPGWSHYGASKAAQLGFMRTAAIELAPQAITVNAILPGNIVTERAWPIWVRTISPAWHARSRRAPSARPLTSAISRRSWRRTSQPYITGQAIAVDGGQVLPESPDAVTP